MSENNINVPKIRFPGLTDAWEQRKLGDITESFSGGTPSAGNSQYYGGTIPFIRSGEISSDKTELFVTEAGLNNSSAKMVKVGDVLYALYGATSGEVSISRINGAINQAILAIRSTRNDDHYIIAQWLRMQKEAIISTYLQGGQGNLSGSIVKELMISLPADKKEQKLISSFFHNLDNLITLHQRKLNHLEDEKKGLLQKMFPKNGKDFPELRFPGFTDAWEQRRLVEYTKLITKGTTPKDKSGKGDINFVKVENISDGKITPIAKISKDEHETYLKRSILEKDDILFSIAGTLGRTAVVDGSILPANTNQALAIIRGYKFDTNYLITILGGRVVTEYIRKNPTVGAQPNLSLKQVGNLVIDTPSIKEQKKIGAFFKQLDHLITLHQRKLEHLQDRKKALLQQMFI